LGTPHCPKCQVPVTTQTPEQITDFAYADAEGETCLLLAPMVRERKGEYRKEMVGWAKEGFVRARIDGEVRRLDEEITLARYEKHTIELVLDRLTLSSDEKSRFSATRKRAGGAELLRPRSPFQPTACVSEVPDRSSRNGASALLVQRSARGMFHLQRPWGAEHLCRGQALRSRTFTAG
jgi:excinuclease UvrABC ATPase subunit